MIDYQSDSDNSTGRRFRVCGECLEAFSTVRGIRQHQQSAGHSHADVNHVTAEVVEQ